MRNTTPQVTTKDGDILFMTIRVCGSGDGSIHRDFRRTINCKRDFPRRMAGTDLRRPGKRQQRRKLNTLTDADLSSDEESDGPTGSAEKEFPEDQENYTLA